METCQRDTHSRLPRLLGLIELLRGGQQRNAEDLAICLNISRRTLFRDLRTLQQSGVPVAFNASSQCYELRRPVKSHAQIAPVDALSMALLLRRANTRQLLQAAACAETEILNHFPSTVRNEISAAMDWIVPEVPTPAQDDHERHLKTLFHCYYQRRKARINYVCSQGKTQGTLLCPYQLVVKDADSNAPVVVGYSSFHRENIGVPLPRILSATTTEDEFDPTPRQVYTWACH